MEQVFEKDIIENKIYYIETDLTYGFNRHNKNANNQIFNNNIDNNHYHNIYDKFYNKSHCKQIGIFSKIIKYPIGNYYSFSYSKDIGNKFSGRHEGENTFDINFTKIFIPNKKKLLFLQVIRQKIKDIFLIQYLINLSFI